MRCPVCASETRYVASTEVPEGYIVSIRQCEAKDQHPLNRFETIELPYAVVSVLGAKKFKKGVDTARRGIQQRALQAQRREVVAKLYGHRTNSSIATYLGITEARVRQIAGTLRELGELTPKQVRQHIMKD